MTETVNIEFNDKKGNFNITSKGRKVALMTFVFAGPKKSSLIIPKFLPHLTEKDWGKISRKGH